MTHLSYFGTQVAVSGIFLLFTKFYEISGTLVAELEHLIIPFLFTITPMSVGYFFYKKYTPSFSTKYITYLFLIYLAYNPMRTFIAGNT
jgi:hypothetical protein